MICSFFFKILFIYSWETERQRHRQREKQAPCRDPNVGLDPGTPGSHPGPKAGTQPLSHPGIPICSFLYAVLVQLLSWGFYSHIKWTSQLFCIWKVQIELPLTSKLGRILFKMEVCSFLFLFSSFIISWLSLVIYLDSYLFIFCVSITRFYFGYCSVYI